MFRTVPLSIIRSLVLYTQQYIQVWWQLACKLSSNLYDIYHCCVYNSWWWTEELSEACRVSFQNKFEKLMHLVGLLQGYLLRHFLLKLWSFGKWYHVLWYIVTSTLENMKPWSYCGTMIPVYQTVRRYIPVNYSINVNLCEDLNSYKSYLNRIFVFGHFWYFVYSVTIFGVPFV
jgi:hypothetical protein